MPHVSCSSREPSTSPTSPQPCESIVNALEMFIMKERVVMQAEIRKLQAENALLLKENGALLRRAIPTDAHHVPVSAIVAVDSEKASVEAKKDVVSTLMDKVQHYQRFLVKEREASAKREASFESSFREIKDMVEQIMKPAATEAQEGSGSTHTTSPVSPHKSSDKISSSSGMMELVDAASEVKSKDLLVNRIMTIAADLSKRVDEFKAIQELAESKAKQVTSKIALLERKSEGLTLLRKHSTQTDLELDVLKMRIKRLETAALEFVPLAEQDILLDFETVKDEVLKVQTRQKQRRKKQERWGLWRE